ncbi:MAG: GAF domain-containing protein [Hyphomicrobiales bacterium]|nr:GAF domain-containing protein [Hyphomicrobiales bacterium]
MYIQLPSSEVRPRPLRPPAALRGIIPGKPRSSWFRGRLFAKYVALFVAVVCVALITNAALEILFFYREHESSLVRIQSEQAEAVSGKIGQFVGEIEAQLGWTVQLPWDMGTLEQRRLDAMRLLRQVPAITELSQIDPNGRERLRISRVEPNVMDSQVDMSKEKKFVEAVAHKIYFGPVYFRYDSEPYMTLALAGARRETGVSVAEVNLKFIWNVISNIKVGEHGRAFVVDAQDRLIAHPDINLVLRGTNVSGSSLIRNIRAAASSGVLPGSSQAVNNLQNKPVLTAYAQVAPLGWLVFVELPREEAHAQLYATLQRTALVLLAALALAAVSGMFLARRMVGPIQALQAGAASIGRGDLKQRISVKTGDELEALADQFNEMAARLENSYTNLERDVEARTRELAQSVNELRALGEVSQAVNSTLDLEEVLTTIVTKAVQISNTEAGAIYVFDEGEKEFHLRATHGMPQTMIAELTEYRLKLDTPPIAKAIADRVPVEIPDLRELPSSPVASIILRSGFRALIAIPLMRPDRIIGLLVVRRREPGLFPGSAVDLLTTFAAQSVLAIQNARLFSELGEKSRQLEIESRHKSQFLANMSHELRTPLNAILGYTELTLDNIYGEAPARMRQVMERVQTNGHHLLGLINDVLDLAKIEAGQFTLSTAPYSLNEVVSGVVTSLEPLATEKHLALETEIAPELPAGHGDERRIAQVLMNLVGNAIKFTDVGKVTIKASAADGTFTVAVCDTGPGVNAVDQHRIFDEFQQADSSTTKRKAGTGLGLAIARKIVERHHGRIWVDSLPGNGATFSFTLPVNSLPRDERS